MENLSEKAANTFSRSGFTCHETAMSSYNTIAANVFLQQMLPTLMAKLVEHLANFIQ